MTPSYPSTFHWHQSMTVHRDDRYHKDPTFFVDRDVVITEKMDGGVATINDGNAYARSSNLPTNLPWFTYMKNRTVPKFYDLEITVCVMGEDCYGVHSIVYDPLPDTFFLFHVLDRLIDNIETPNTAGDILRSWADCEAMAAAHDVLTVPVLYRGRFAKLDDITQFFMDNIGKRSIYGPDREGFVIRDAGAFAFDDFALHTAKFVRPHHVQTDEHWTRNWKPARLLKP